MIERLITISPSTNKPILERNGLSDIDLSQLPERSLEAFQTWRKTTLKKRQQIVEKALDLISKKQDDLAKELTDQMGRPISYTGIEIKTAVSRARYLLKISDETLADTPGEAEKGFKRFIRKEPVGPVLIIFAWNVGLWEVPAS